MNRRQSLKTLLGASAAAVLSGCAEEFSEDRYTPEDIELLAQQKVSEQTNSGSGPFGRHVYQGYRGLAELPWFELDERGKLVCIDDSIPAAIDMHCHLGMSILFEPKLDLLAKHPRTRHLLDCDATTPGCELDLDVYINANFSHAALEQLSKDLRSQALFGSDTVATHTIPNLLEEMDAMRVEQAVLLPITFNLWFGDRQTTQWREAVANAKTNRLINGFSVSPHSKHPVEDLEREHAKGGRIVKLHPTVQRFFPDDTNLNDFYARAEELGVIVFYHGGRAGIEPESSHPYAMPRHYEATFKNFPKLRCIIGHGGARDATAMLQLAEQYNNVWLGTHGQGLTQLHTMIQTLKGQRLVFGTDWPFYHVGASLAKILIVTEGANRDELRQQILRNNALPLIS